MATQKAVLTWEHPPFKVSQPAGEFLHGKPPLQFSNISSYGPGKKAANDFDGSDFVDICPQNSSLISRFLRKTLPQYFEYKPDKAKVVSHFRKKKTGPPVVFLVSFLDVPIWQGSSQSIITISRVLVSLMSVLFLVIPMFALTYIRPTGFLLLAAALFSVIFAFIVAVTSRARHHEIFGVTAAYAAVLMVFVGNAVSNRPPGGH